MNDFHRVSYFIKQMHLNVINLFKYRYSTIELCFLLPPVLLCVRNNKLYIYGLHKCEKYILNKVTDSLIQLSVQSVQDYKSSGVVIFRCLITGNMYIISCGTSWFSQMGRWLARHYIINSLLPSAACMRWRTSAYNGRSPFPPVIIVLSNVNCSLLNAKWWYAIGIMSR